MKSTKYLLVAKLPEPEERAHAEIQQNLKEEISSFRIPSSTIGAHITICQASTLFNPKKLDELIGKLAYFLYRIESLHVTMSGWNFFAEAKTNHKILYRTLDAQELVHKRLCEIQEIALKYMQPAGPRHLYPHFHQTLGNIRCKQEDFNALVPAINTVILEHYLPKRLLIDRYVLYCKKPKDKDWEIQNIFRHVPRS